jgi:hypothetical protein
MEDDVKDFVLMMLGVPIVKIEIDEKALDNTIRHVRQFISVYQPNMQKDSPLIYDLMVKEGSLAYVKYIVGRIRAKYPTVNAPCGDMKDGLYLTREGTNEIQNWKRSIVLANVQAIVDKNKSKSQH